MNGGPHQSRVPEFKCPEDNTWIIAGELEDILGTTDWRTCGINVGLLMENFYNLTFFVYFFLGKH